MKIAVDIDSTLHHYWNVLSDAARRRFGIDLPYEEQLDWGITRLRPEQLALCVAETHCDQTIAASEPYPGAVETVARWHAGGHYIHVTSHRAGSAHDATARWLERIGLPYDDLYCSFDKVSRCVELGIDLLVDDSPLNIVAALEHGIRVATIVHPWNREVCEEEADVIAAADWHELAAKLEPLLLRRPRPV
ncbi:MAG: hypothetical protein M3296_06695 [Actinomycetota bacterium]|nr:hypothetical protein [Actinomycetota bacterium]